MTKKTALIVHIVGIQVGSIFLLSCFVWALQDCIGAVSCALGGLVGVVGGLLQAFKVFGIGNVVVPTHIFLRRFYAGHWLKLMITAIALATIFTFFTVDALWLIGGLCMSQLCYLILPFAQRG